MLVLGWPSGDSPSVILGRGTEHWFLLGALSGLASHWANVGPMVGMSGVGIRAPPFMDFPAAPVPRSAMKATLWPRCPMRARARSTRSAGSGPATSTVCGLAVLVAASTKISPTVWAAIPVDAPRGTCRLEMPGRLGEDRRGFGV